MEKLKSHFYAICGIMIFGFFSGCIFCCRCGKFPLKDFSAKFQGLLLSAAS